jgi:cytochrome P450
MESILDFYGFSGIGYLFLATLLVSLWYYGWPLLFHPLQHVPGPTPLPVLGNIHLFVQNGFGKTDLALMKKYGKVFRIHMGRKPGLFVADVDLLRQILVKDFAMFTNRTNVSLNQAMSTYHLLGATDDDWRRHRHLLSPYFASGKMKKLIPQILKCVSKFCKQIKEHVDNGKETEAKELAGFFTMDVIASTSFGLDLDSQQTPNHPFVHHANRLIGFGPSDFLSLIVVIAPFMVPILQKLGVSTTDKAAVDFFANFMMKLLSERQANESKESHDLIQLLVKLHNNSDTKKQLSFEEIVAEGILFFLAAYDTTSSATAFLMYELSRHPATQEKLYSEMKKSTGNWNDLSYETVIKLSYLDQCIHETLRMYPIAPTTNRLAGQDANINKLFIPLYALQHDEDIWPEQV